MAGITARVLLVFVSMAGSALCDQQPNIPNTPKADTIGALPTTGDTADATDGLTVLPNVLTKDQATASYGKSIASRYYVVSLTLINRGQLSVLLQAAAYHSAAAAQDVAFIPITTVLIDVQKQESRDFRTRSQMILTWISLALPGPTPFFRNALSRGTYTLGLSIFDLARTSAFATFPDPLDKVIQLLQSNRLFVQNSQIGAHLPVTLDLFIGVKQLAAGTAVSTTPSGGKTKDKLLDPYQVLSALGKITVAYSTIPAESKTLKTQ